MDTFSGAPLIPINDLKRKIDSAPAGLMEAARRALASGWWLNGKETTAFCEAFATYVGVGRCIAVANGTDALEIAMRVLSETRCGGGTEVVTVANAGGYSTIASRLVGLIPVYADIEESSQLVSLSSIISALGQQTAFVVVTHLYGHIVDVMALRTMMNDAGYSHIPILEDCAQAHGARLNGKMAGSFGDLATFSFYPTKNLGAFGDGGAIVTSDLELAERCNMLRQYGWKSKYSIAISGGRNSRLDEVQAAILRELLPVLDDANAQRVKILNRYTDAAPTGVRVVRGDGGTVAHLAVMLCDDRENLRQHLLYYGIQSDIHYPVLDCDQPGWQRLPQREAPGSLAVSRASVGRLLTLPCFPTMTDDEVDRVCDTLSGWSR
jgi:aminotransferase EvaB